MDLARFVKEFGFHHINVKRDYPRSYVNYGYKGTASYYNDENEIIEMEIDRRRLEHMADYVQRAEDRLNKDQEESWLRNKHPALKEAYSKYQMLVELYK